MIWKFLLLFLLIGAVSSCSKDAKSKTGTYIVSASKLIGLAGNSWNNDSLQLKYKTGYQYTKAPENLTNVLKATVSLPAVDDSNRTVNGAILLNVAPNFYSLIGIRSSRRISPGNEINNEFLIII